MTAFVILFPMQIYQIEHPVFEVYSRVVTINPARQEHKKAGAVSYAVALCLGYSSTLLNTNLAPPLAPSSTVTVQPWASAIR